MEPRRRQSASASTSNSHDERATQRKASGSVTPKLDLDDDGLPRRTRNRNPLPPTRGPLFPPLPPRQPKNSPKNSPSNRGARSPGAKPLRLASSSALSSAVADDESEAGVGDESTVDVPAAADDKAPSLSLSPPPADGDEMDIDDSIRVENDGDKSIDADDWDTYRRHRGVRGFGGAGKVAVKVEPSEDEATEPPEGDDAVAATNGNAFDSEALATRDSASASAEPLSRSQRKRRGEDQLLLDDHLLPKEVRGQGALAPRREGTKPRRSGEPSELAPENKPVAATDDKEETPKADVADEPAVASGDGDEAGDVVDDGEGDGDLDGDDDDDDGNDVTRCVCHRQDIDVMMIQCDKCNVWQHGACMGIWGDDEAPDEYFCEECKPELHVPLRKWIRHCGRNPLVHVGDFADTSANFIAPEPEDLQRYHSRTSQVPPSQSKRWADPKADTKQQRSHHRKEPENADPDRRMSRRGAPPAQPVGRDKAALNSKDSGRDRRRGTTARRVSTDLSLSGSPPRGEPKKRSTMNSRDAAYEAAIKASLAEARENSGEQSEPPEERKRRRGDVEDRETEPPEPKKGKKKAKDDEEAEPAPTLSKPKHPNQYTYRPKAGTGPAASPARRGGGTPQPLSGPPPTHEHGTRRAGAIASTLASQPYHAMSIHNLNWYLPDHLSQHSDMLPTSAPRPLEVPTPRHLQYLTRSHFFNQHYGPFSDERDANGNLVLPGDAPMREVEGDATNHREPPTRVRYPVRRLNTGEMRKRVSNLLEYVTRVQEEERRRGERAKEIGIPPTSEPRRLSLDSDDPLGIPVARDRPQPPSSQQLLDELTIDLIAFQEAFNTGDFESLPFAQPPIREPTPEMELPVHLEPPHEEEEVPTVEQVAAVLAEKGVEAVVDDHLQEERANEREASETVGLPRHDGLENGIEAEAEVEVETEALEQEHAPMDVDDEVEEEVTIQAKIEFIEAEAAQQPVQLGQDEVPQELPEESVTALPPALDIMNEAAADAAAEDLAKLGQLAAPVMDPIPAADTLDIAEDTAPAGETAAAELIEEQPTLATKPVLDVPVGLGTDELPVTAEAEAAEVAAA